MLIHLLFFCKLGIQKNEKHGKMLSMENKNKGKKLTRRKQDEKKHCVLFLPHEILVEILSWLTVEPLLRCKCVCKQWNAIIQDRKFVEMQMTRNKGIHYSKRKSRTLNPEGLEETFTYQYTYDGLLLEKSMCTLKFRIRNPSTKQMRVLPDPHWNSMLCFIYFHFSTGTYRVMSIGRYGSNIGGCEVLDLGGSDLSWRPLNISPYDLNLNKFKNKTHFLLIDGMLHCFRLAWAGPSNAEIFSLDLQKEEVCTSVSVPRNFFSDWWKVKFISWDGKPALVRLRKEELIVWKLEDYKIQKWADSKIVISLPFSKIYPKMKGCCPWIAQDGLLYFRVKMVDSFVYHIESKSLKNLPEASSDNMPYHATLVTLNGMQPEKKQVKKVS